MPFSEFFPDYRDSTLWTKWTDYAMMNFGPGVQYVHVNM
jgi:hypothetical protein